jgi:hypothetical protein
VVRRIHTMLVERGYDGPAPYFGPQWDALFQPPHPVVRAPVRGTGSMR